ncbi:MAG: helix-turn-helix domain-containing protein, partial [Ruminococcus sp.]|nr:helix-turn-helix domain-containing protein [Ruminococcus sp.]
MYNPQTTYLRIKNLADIRGISISRISEECQINKNTIAQSANSQDGMKAKKLFDISKCLNCSVDYLLGKSEDPTGHLRYSIGNNNGNNNGTITNHVNGSEPNNNDISEEMIKKFNSLYFYNKARVI